MACKIIQLSCRGKTQEPRVQPTTSKSFCSISNGLCKESPITRMHCSGMRTARSLPVCRSHIICQWGGGGACVPCMPPVTHAPHAWPPLAMHAPCHACSHHACPHPLSHMPPAMHAPTMHASHLPCMPPAMHAPTMHASHLPCMPPAMHAPTMHAPHHACPLPCMPPTCHACPLPCMPPPCMPPTMHAPHHACPIPCHTCPPPLWTDTHL